MCPTSLGETVSRTLVGLRGRPRPVLVHAGHATHLPTRGGGPGLSLGALSRRDLPRHRDAGEDR